MSVEQQEIQAYRPDVSASELARPTATYLPNAFEQIEMIYGSDEDGPTRMAAFVLNRASAYMAENGAKWTDTVQDLERQLTEARQREAHTRTEASEITLNLMAVRTEIERQFGVQQECFQFIRFTHALVNQRQDDLEKAKQDKIQLEQVEIPDLDEAIEVVMTRIADWEKTPAVDEDDINAKFTYFEQEAAPNQNELSNLEARLATKNKELCELVVLQSRIPKQMVKAHAAIDAYQQRARDCQRQLEVLKVQMINLFKAVKNLARPEDLHAPESFFSSLWTKAAKIEFLQNRVDKGEYEWALAVAASDPELSKDLTFKLKRPTNPRPIETVVAVRAIHTPPPPLPPSALASVVSSPTYLAIAASTDASATTGSMPRVETTPPISSTIQNAIAAVNTQPAPPPVVPTRTVASQARAPRPLADGGTYKSSTLHRILGLKPPQVSEGKGVNKREHRKSK